MSDWTDYLTPQEASRILATPTGTRYAARNDRGEKVTRYVAPTQSELAKIRVRANAG